MSTEYGSYAGKVVYINLTDKSWREYPVSDKERELFLGGTILAARILHDLIKAPIDPLSPDNYVVVTTCPLNGTGTPCTARFNVSAISPLTGLLTSSNCGGNFGLSLKRSGYDGIILAGKCDELSIVEITETGVNFLPAEHLRGKLTAETQEIIGGRSGKLVIGPAGENLVKYACAVSNERAAGRGGIGAVLGSKNVKAITALGFKTYPVKNKEKMIALNKRWTGILKAHPLTGSQLPKLGTAGLLSTMNQKSILATKNFSAGKFNEFRNISGETLAEKYLIKNTGCSTCPIQCARVVEVDGKEVKGPEVEVMGLLGANILNDNLEEIIRWNYLLDEYGMDTISFAGTVAFAMELDEKHIWNSGLQFGKIDNISDLIKDVAFRNGEVANLIADGSKRLSQKFGGEEYCINVKGMELSAYEPRGAVGQGLGYSISNRGGCHLNGGYAVVLEGLGLNINPLTKHGKAQLTITFQNLMEAVSAGGNCLFTTYAVLPGFLISKPNSKLSRLVNFVLPFLGPVVTLINKHTWIASFNLEPILPHTKALRHATGMKFNIGKLMEVGKRGYNLERLINTRLGVSEKDDKLPRRLTHEPQIKYNEKTVVPQASMRKVYYRGRGWDKTGMVKKSTLRKLHLNNLEDLSLVEANS